MCLKVRTQLHIAVCEIFINQISNGSGSVRLRLLVFLIEIRKMVASGRSVRHIAMSLVGSVRIRVIDVLQLFYVGSHKFL